MLIIYGRIWDTPNNNNRHELSKICLDKTKQNKGNHYQKILIHYTKVLCAAKTDEDGNDEDGNDKLIK